MKQETEAFRLDSLIIPLREERKEAALRELLAAAGVFSTLRDKDQFYRAVLNRERIGNTGFGHGVAVAHGKIPGLRGVKIALGLSPGGIEYGAPDGERVHFLFLVASPREEGGEYLRCLTALVRVLHKDGLREAFLHEENPRRLLALLNREFLKEKARTMVRAAEAIA